MNKNYLFEIPNEGKDFIVRMQDFGFNCGYDESINPKTKLVEPFKAWVEVRDNYYFEDSLFIRTVINSSKYTGRVMGLK